MLHLNKLKSYSLKNTFCKFGWNQSNVSGRSWKCEELKDRWTFVQEVIRKDFQLRWANKKTQGDIPVEKGERLRVPNDTGVISCRASSCQPYKLITQQNNTCMFLAFKNALLKCSNKNQILLK